MAFIIGDVLRVSADVYQILTLSLIIMLEKPFAVVDFIKLKDTQGVSVGFRSTRIRTLYNSLIAILSSQIVSCTIDNMELREYR